ncbi:MAG: hypothetical protein IKC47_00395 [Clostridia bacterium]|nr:hypothetical protein [Clostridia bacterium]
MKEQMSKIKRRMNVLIAIGIISAASLLISAFVVMSEDFGAGLLMIISGAISLFLTLLVPLSIKNLADTTTYILSNTPQKQSVGTVHAVSKTLKTDDQLSNCSKVFQKLINVLCNSSIAHKFPNRNDFSRIFEDALSKEIVQIQLDSMQSYVYDKVVSACQADDIQLSEHEIFALKVAISNLINS